jgi:hypothetical protein
MALFRLARRVNGGERNRTVVSMRSFGERPWAAPCSGCQRTGSVGRGTGVGDLESAGRKARRFTIPDARCRSPTHDPSLCTIEGTGRLVSSIRSEPGDSPRPGGIGTGRPPRPGRGGTEGEDRGSSWSPGRLGRVFGGLPYFDCPTFPGGVDGCHGVGLRNPCAGATAGAHGFGRPALSERFPAWSPAWPPKPAARSGSTGP